METKTQAVYSEKLLTIAKAPSHRGAIFQMEADDKGLVLIESKVQSLKIYILVDPDQDFTLECRFFTYGGPVFTALAEEFCNNSQGKIVEDLLKITPEIIEQNLRDSPDNSALPLNSPELKALGQIIQNLVDSYPDKKQAALATKAIRANANFRMHTAEGREQSDKEWFNLSEVEKLRAIETTLDERVRQALQMDGGDLEVLDLVNDTKVIIRYHGNCSSCSAAIGGTLIFIENQLRENVYYNLTVEPEPMDWMM